MIGAHDANGTSISLEPGNQLELSLKPFSNIIEIDVKASELLKLLDEIGNTYNVLFLGYGISPNSNVNEIYMNLILKTPIKDKNSIDSINGEWSEEQIIDVKLSPGTPLFFEFEATKEKLGEMARCDEDVLSYIAFPTQAEAFFEKREADRKNTFSYTITRID